MAKKIFFILAFILAASRFSYPAPSEEVAAKANQLMAGVSGTYRWQSMSTPHSEHERLNELYDDNTIKLTYENGVLILHVMPYSEEERSSWNLEKVEENKVFFKSGMQYQENLEEDGNIHWYDLTNVSLELDFSASITKLKITYTTLEKILEKESKKIIEKTIHEGAEEGVLKKSDGSRIFVRVSDFLGKTGKIVLTGKNGNQREIPIRYVKSPFLSLEEDELFLLKLEINTDGTGFKEYDLLSHGRFHSISYEKDSPMEWVPIINYYKDGKFFSCVIFFTQNENGHLVGEGVYKVIPGSLVGDEVPHFVPQENGLVEEGTATMILKKE
ncbi:MAG: hypothetical protein HYY62_02040 [Deltaproteobacteria bacterium]|nr:hypothetical protein [Deltaproteobacteria bacterium]